MHEYSTLKGWTTAISPTWTAARMLSQSSSQVDRIAIREAGGDLNSKNCFLLLRWTIPISSTVRKKNPLSHWLTGTAHLYHHQTCCLLLHHTEAAEAWPCVELNRFFVLQIQKNYPNNIKKCANMLISFVSSIVVTWGDDSTIDETKEISIFAYWMALKIKYRSWKEDDGFFILTFPTHDKQRSAEAWP